MRVSVPFRGYVVVIPIRLQQEIQNASGICFRPLSGLCSSNFNKEADLTAIRGEKFPSPFGVM